MSQAFRPRPAQDFFAELVSGSQSQRAPLLALREKWLRGLELEGREELLFELEMLLRGIERSFNLHNLPLVDASVSLVNRNFKGELEDIRDALDHAVLLCRRLLDPVSDQLVVFRRYVETQLTDDRARRALLEAELREERPEDSLALLREHLSAQRTVLDHLLRLDRLPLPLFQDFGALLLREVLQNRFFRPFRPLEFRLEYDRVKSVPLLESLRLLPGLERRHFTTAVLALFRLLHYLAYLEPGSEEPTGTGASPRRQRVVLALVRSETWALAGYLQDEVARDAEGRRHRVGALKAARDLHREMARIHRELLLALDVRQDALATAHALLRTLFRDSLALLARVLEASSGPARLGPDAFARLVSRTDMAARLRRDLHALAVLTDSLVQALEAEDDPTSRLAALHGFLAEFQDVSYQLLRYGDYAFFDRALTLWGELQAVPPGPAVRQRLAEDGRAFAHGVRAAFAHVARRAELLAHPFDPEEARPLLARFGLS